MNLRLSSLRAMFVRPDRGRLAAAVVALMLAGAGVQSAVAAPGDAASAPDAASVSASVSYTAGGQYTVRPGQSLNDVAIAVTQSHDRATLARAARALFDANPNAFMGRDPSRLRLGAVLTVPVLDASGAMAASSAATAASAPTATGGSSSNAAVAASGGASPQSAATHDATPETPAAHGAASAATDASSAATGSVVSSAPMGGSEPASAASGTHVWAGSVQPSASEAAAGASAAAGMDASQPRAKVSSLQQLLALKNRVLMELQKHGIGGSSAAPVAPSATGTQPATAASSAALVPGHAAAAISTSNQTGISQTSLAVGAAVGAALVVLLTTLRLGRRKRERMAEAQAASSDGGTAARAVEPADSIARPEQEVPRAVHDANDAAAQQAAAMAAAEREAAEGEAAAREMSERVAAEREAEIRAAVAREAEAREAAERAAEHGTVEQAAAERTAENGAVEGAAADREAAEEDAAGRTSADRAVAEQAAEAEQLAAEQTATESVAAEKAAAQQAAEQHSPAEQASAEHLAAQRAAADQLAAQQAADGLRTAQQTASHQSPGFSAADADLIGQHNLSQAQPAAPKQTDFAPPPHHENLDAATMAASLDAAAELGADALPRAPLEPIDEAWEPEPLSHRLEWDDEPLPDEPMEPLVPQAPATTGQVDEANIHAHGPREFPRDAVDAFGSLDMPLPPRVEPAAGVVPASETPSSQPVASPEATARQAVPPHDADKAPHTADEIAAGTAGRAAVAGLGAGGVGTAGFGALKLDFDLELPPSPAQPLPAFTPADLARIARNKLDLAAEYIELGDLAGARTLINEVIEANDPATRNDARALLSTLAPLS
ncbi:FimV/HubP family polar landmark protein [Paraburkholderia rhynchosiae]|uniref:Fimbrial protein FimV n=1 Tax=Paraburkholderia rhynchosiae TaxID=487049 RepID=A0A2N7WAR3_9BURK|nr:FimV/HubP family polar landmark protein [Paraburkholderia rhynchosiae]PMS26455.1 fimbrial protein FimV [Paraburkholderia rhynchosiae]CAB3716251.1 hypothetical protein LMG27174_04579 [Paraburkholderia rhynchosiae]